MHTGKDDKRSDKLTFYPSCTTTVLLWGSQPMVAYPHYARYQSSWLWQRWCPPQSRPTAGKQSADPRLSMRGEPVWRSSWRVAAPWHPVVVERHVSGTGVVPCHRRRWCSRSPRSPVDRPGATTADWWGGRGREIPRAHHFQELCLPHQPLAESLASQAQK